MIPALSRALSAALGAGGLSVFITATPVAAQGWQCAAPSSLPRAEVEPRPRAEPVRRTAVGGYTLSLGWSPEYCRTRKSSARDRLQCGGEAGDFGFVMHGLWPEGQAGAPWPQYCRPPTPVTPKAARSAFCAMPSVSLMQHEWARHGSCVTRAPDAYFRAARVLFDALQFPDMDRLSRRQPTAAAVILAFADANPGVGEEAIRLDLNERGWLTGVRLCLGTRFRPRPCEGRGLRATAPIKIWRGG